MDAHAEIYEDATGEWRWRLKAGNGEVIASGESHTSHHDAERAFLTVALLAPSAAVELLTDSVQRNVSTE